MKSIGKLKPFYRNSAVLSEKMFIGGLELGGELAAIPPYLLDEDIDFCYLNKKDSNSELMFTDHITLVRFLGGIGDSIVKNVSEKAGNLDLAVLEADGTITINTTLIERYRPLVELYNKEVTVVLDNIPWVFVEGDTIDDYGQVNPPLDYDLWCGFIRDMCHALIESFTYETVNAWRFRIATEGRLNVDTDGYCKHYKLTTSAIKEILPGARFGPYNIAGIGSMDTHSINLYDVLGQDLPVDFSSVSYYAIPRLDDEGDLEPHSVSPYLRAENEYMPFWNKVDDIRDESKKIPREIHELGILTNEYGRFTSEPGARGAAWLFQLLMTMREHADIDKVWHWHTTDVITVPGKKTKDYHRLLRSNAWVYLMLDHMIGLDAYVLDVSAEHTQSDDFAWKAVGFFGEKNYIMVSGFNNNRHIIYDGYVTVEIPKSMYNKTVDGTIRVTYLGDDNDVYQVIKSDLIEKDCLSEGVEKKLDLSKSMKYKHEFYEKRITEIPGTMYPVYGFWAPILATDKGLGYIDNEWPKYEEVIKASLRLKETDYELFEQENVYKIYVPIKTPMTMVIELG